MKLLIEYAELDPSKQVKPIKGFLYSAVLESGDRTAITATIEDIYADYRGDQLEKYLEPEADVFCCCLCEDDESEPKPEDCVFVSTVKKDPVAVLDGLVRRMNAVRISMSDGHFTQTFEGLSVDKKNDEDLWADKYVYTAEDYIYTTTGENVRFMLAYRDSKNVADGNYSFNQKMADNCIPFCFLLEGKFDKKYCDPDSLGNNETSEYQFDFSKERVVLDDKLLVLLKGEYTEERNSSDHINGELIEDVGSFNPSGFFYSGINAVKDKEMTMNPWIAYNVDPDGTGTVIRSRIEDMINRGEYVEINSSYELFRDTRRLADRELRTYGWHLFDANGDKEGMLSEAQTKDILDCFVSKDTDPCDPKAGYVDAHRAKMKIDEAVKDYLNNDGKLDRENLPGFIETLRGLHLVSHDDYYREAVHETGHAVMGRHCWGDGAISKVVLKSSSNDKNERYGGMTCLNTDKTDKSSDCYWSYGILFSLAAKVAEELFFGAAHDGWKYDMQGAYLYMVALIFDKATIAAVDGKIYCYLDSTDAIRADDAFEVLMDRHMEKAKEILLDKKEMIEGIAKILMAEKELSGERFDELCRLYEGKH